MKTIARQVVEKMFAVFAQQDINAIVDTFSDDAVLIHHGTQIMPSAKFIGKEGARMFFEYNIHALEVVYFHTNEFIDAGEDKLIVLGNEHFISKESGAEMKNRWVQIYTITHGLISKMEEFASSAAPESYGGNAGGL
ncbi:nuclear transport factor 2 family protein [Sphingobacterium sp. Mn56C]|uniref:nuclear transport factor 2 family protein n=1 Tax=Sphingobacterium sp. Mn56C TaxID=3395261 RepID=UPI003BE73573